MTQGDCPNDVREQATQLLQGPLKHVKKIGLAAALVPIAAVAASAAEPRGCGSGGTVCGYVWQDTNNNGIREVGEPWIANAVVVLNELGLVTQTNENGVYQFSTLPGTAVAGTYVIAVQIPPGTQPSPANVGDDDTVDSDGVPDGVGNSVATVSLTPDAPTAPATDFGFWVPPVAQPGTGTPGYWKNHPDAWPVPSIVVGGVTYTKAQALAILDSHGKDRTLTMFSSLVSAKLNVVAGNDPSCVSSTIDAADAWMSTNGPAGAGVHPASLAWKIGEPLHRLMDNYNNGMLCAPHRD